MSVTIWHNPKCSTSRKVLEAIRSHGIEPKIVLYVETPPSEQDIKAVLKDTGLSTRELLRRNGTPYDELGLDDPKFTDAKLVALMHKHPLLIQRPVVSTKKGTRLCRPPERVEEIL
ncbi:MAG TPA: arsenate reductase (glutaredoxin) [Xanthobacteraceae bacterium]|nr:arsenate reductase (glutaredoxin) [Xanthobacteraceae bacterium]